MTLASLLNSVRLWLKCKGGGQNPEILRQVVRGPTTRICHSELGLGICRSWKKEDLLPHAGTLSNLCFVGSKLRNI
jgi:hypothetical protein